MQFLLQMLNLMILVMATLIQLRDLNLLLPHLDLHLPNLHLPVLFSMYHGITFMVQLVKVMAVRIELAFEVGDLHGELFCTHCGFS
jgi:hypothetical protein